MQTITVLGNNSGRNAGDMAILGNLLNDINQVQPNIKFRIPTTNPAFIKKHFGHFKMEPIPLLPWYGSLKNFGFPLFWSMLASDAVLITDNILFDRKFYNPVFNNMSSIALFAPFCGKRKIPIILYNASVGPIDHAVGAKALKKIMEFCPLAILRDHQTANLFKRLNIDGPDIRIHADCALNTTPPPEERLAEIIRREGLFQNPKGSIGFNVNAYIDNWSMSGTLTTLNFSKVIADSIDSIIEKLDVDVMFTVTQVMDLKVTRNCVEQMRHQDRVRIVSNLNYTYEEITGLLEKVKIHIGLRTHTLIFSAAMNTPMVCIKSYPKSSGFMETIGQENWMISFEDLNVENLTDIVLKAWECRHETKNAMRPIVDAEKKKARDSATVLINFIK